MGGHVFDHEAKRKPPLSTGLAAVGLVVLGLLGARLWSALHSNVLAADARVDGLNAAENALARLKLSDPRAAAAALVLAAAAGNVELVDDLLGYGVEANSRDASGRSALCAAVAAGETSIARTLLSAGAKLGEGTRATDSELHLAAAHDDALLIDLLIDSGAPLEAHAADLDGASALHVASECGNEHSLAALIRADALVDFADTRGFTALTRATLLGRTAVVQILIKSGADVTRVDRRQRTALHFAAAVGDADCVRALLDAGADAQAVDQYGWTALHYAAAYGRANLVPILARVMEHAALDARNSRGMTALHLAARRGESPCVQALLDLGVDMSLRDQAGRSAGEVAPQDLNGEPWKRLWPIAPVPAARQPDPVLLDCAERRPKICVCTRQARNFREPLVLLDLAIWEDGATVFAPWSANGTRDYVAGSLAPSAVENVFRDLNETGWLDTDAPAIDRTKRDSVELTIARKEKYQRIAWDEVERADLAQDLQNRAAIVDWSLGWARARDVLRAARPRSTQVMSFVLVRGAFRGLVFEDGPHAPWME